MYVQILRELRTVENLFEKFLVAYIERNSVRWRLCTYMSDSIFLTVENNTMPKQLYPTYF